MSRWLLVSALVACGGGREVSKIRYTHVQCDDCGVAPTAGEQFVQPDAERRVAPEEPVAADPNAPQPEPTCRLVAETLVSLELGNYAEPEERAPRVAAEERRCVAMRLSRDDRQCVVDSYARADVAYCVPALFPDEPQQPALSGAECDAIANQMRKQLEAQLASQRVPDQRVWERQLLTAIDACRADRWNQQMAQCAASYVPMYADNCAWIQPTGMWKKLTARLAKARGDAPRAAR